MEPQDILVQRIAAYVATQVPPEQRAIVTRTVCMAIATLMADPAFTEELVMVKALREENRWLRNNYLIMKQMMDRVGVKVAPVRKRAAPRKRAAGSSANAKAASPKRRKPPSPNSSFRQGFNEMRGGSTS